MSEITEVLLREITETDTDNIVQWRNNINVRKNLFSQEELKAEQHRKYLKNVVEAGKCKQYIIHIRNNQCKKDIGTIFIKNIDKKNRKGEFGIFIGEESYRGKGYARKASIKILKMAFEEMGLNRVYLSVMADNAAAIKTYGSIGFSIEGTLRQDYFRGDEYIDVLLMAITKDEWINRM